MADNTVLPTGSGGDTIRDVDNSLYTASATATAKTQVVKPDLGGEAGEVLATGYVGGEMLVRNEPAQLFAETWDSLLIDTVNKWVLSGAGNSIPAVVNAASPGLLNDGGSVTINSGTVAGSWAALQSIPMFAPTDPGWLHVKQTNNFEFPLLTTGYRFWGTGTLPANPTIATPVLNGVGWEITTAGALVAVCYASGVRNVIGTPAVPANSSPHKYFTYFRGDLAYWFYDAITTPLYTMATGATGPNVNAQPLLMLAISNGGAAVTITNNGLQVSDTTHNTMTIGDGQLPFRKVTVKAAGIAPTALDNAFVVSLSPTSQNPINASQEQGGLLSQLVEIERQNGAMLRAIYMQLAQLSGVDVRPDDLTDFNSLQ